MNTALTIPKLHRINLVAKGSTCRVLLADSLAHKKPKERKLELLLTRISNLELLVSFVNRGCVILDMRTKVKPLDLFRTGLPMTACRQLATALNKHIIEEISNG